MESNNPHHPLLSSRMFLRRQSSPRRRRTVVDPLFPSAGPTSSPPPFPFSRLGISPTAYHIKDPHLTSSSHCPVVSPDETEIVFFDEDKQNYSSPPSNVVNESKTYDSNAVLMSSPPPSSTSTQPSPPPVTPILGLRFSVRAGNKASTETKRRAKEILKHARWNPEKSMPSSSSSTTSSTTASSIHHPNIKIFLLLLEPESKIFELIQLVFPKKNTTIADLIAMIPKNATEPALAQLKYMGFTRPGKHRPAAESQSSPPSILDPKETVANLMILQGEILVAIPKKQAQDVPRIVRLSQQILANQHIQKLMGQSNPFQRRNQRKKSKTSSSSTTSQSSTATWTSENTKMTTQTCPPLTDRENYSRHRHPNIRPLSTQTEAVIQNHRRKISPLQDQFSSSHSTCNTNAHPVPSPVHAHDDLLQEYMSSDVLIKVGNSSGNNRLRHSIHVHDNDDTSLTNDDLSFDGSSLASSFHSWTQSLTVSECPTPQLRKKRVAKFLRVLRSTLLLGWILSILWYRWDLEHRASADVIQQRALVPEQPLGLRGIVPFFITFCVLVKFQKFLEAPRHIFQSRCPVLQLLTQIYENRGNCIHHPGN